MATYYVQEASRTAHRKKKWTTHFSTEEKDLGAYLSQKLGVNFRMISKTALMRREGRPALSQAENEVRDLNSTIADAIRAFEEEYWREKEREEAEGKTAFILRDMPSPLHQSIKDAADRSGMSMTEWIFEACRKALKGKG